MASFNKKTTALLICSLLTLLSSCGKPSDGAKTVELRPVCHTASVDGEADDCAIWIHPQDPALSVVIGDDKSEEGALYVFDLEGREIFRTETLDRPVNIDVRYGVDVGGRRIDVVACGLRTANQLKIFEIDPATRRLVDITTAEGIASGHDEKTYGLCLYKRPADDQLFAFVSKKGPGNIHQIALHDDGHGKFRGDIVRSFGAKDIPDFCEGMCADDDLGFVYLADEDFGVLKYQADPALGDDKLLSSFAQSDGIRGDREGLALYAYKDGGGYLLLSSQGDNTLKVYDRASNAYLFTLETQGSTETDGIAATSFFAGPRFPAGLVVCHNDRNNNFALYSLEKCFR